MSVSGERRGSAHLFYLHLGEQLVEAKLSVLFASALGKTCRHYSIFRW